MSFYHGSEPGGTPGLLPDPYYWWEAGALMGALIDYWYYTGDPKWNKLTEQGMLFQVGPNNDYMPPNQTRTEGNDDQGFWAMAAMSAAENKFPNPPDDKPQWLALAQAVFNTQASRWDPDECGGGLRWQIFTWNNGYDYKNSISQACFFNIAARLARYTGNQSYADWAEKTWDWMLSTELINPDTYYIYDGIHTTDCRNATPYQWTYNAGAFLLGAAAMYNYSTGDTQAKWRGRVEHLLNGTMVFFTGPDANIMTEVACEPVDLCDLDQQSFKAYLSRWMAATTKWAPWTHDRIKPLLLASAKAAASTCKGGANGRMCGLKWTEFGKWDGSQGVGQQMAAMEVVLANIIEHVASPVTNRTGGISSGDPGAGGMDVGRTDPFAGCDGLHKLSSRDPILGLDALFDTILDTIRAFKEHRLSEYFASNFARHGNTYCSLALGLKMLVTCDRENIETALTTKFDDDFPIGGPRLHTSLLVLGPQSVFSSSGAVWREARDMIHPSFVRDQNFLAAVPSDGITFDMEGLLLKLTMDSSTGFMLGYSANSLVQASPEGAQSLYDFEPPILTYLPHRKLSAARVRLRNYIRFYIRKVAAENEKGNLSKTVDRSYVFLDKLLKAGVPEEYVIGQVFVSNCSWAGNHGDIPCFGVQVPCQGSRVVRRLRTEIADVRVDDPSWDTVKGMKFLNNVIRGVKSQRLFPTIVLNARTANKETVLPRGGGPGGTRPILLPADVYGPDAEAFNPDRWEILRAGWDYIPFHGGPRICLGQQFALSQMALIVYRFFRNLSVVDAREEGGPFMKAVITFSFANGCLVGGKK
ncbi:glycosyl hydrolase family 76-domain-containing protein [Immersiella caudata]|uniref:mannan endo-1,6-alpha-mannosidase n=1 Tax=Immersiella caudata TaxID=314043 RepID=A0AA39XIA0_9PEZI|nr:glycosyl hydrolase family 76-domain-containing protein [Immersiella caudata]